MNVAVISCKKQKQDYSCPADEMYDKSFVYRAQRNFIKEAYDKYLIMSTKYGLILPTKVIDPYDMSLYKNPSINFSKTERLDDESKYWLSVGNKINEILDLGHTLHFHTSHDYFKPLDKEIKDKVTHVVQPRAFGLTQTIYEEALEMHKNNTSLDDCIKHITKKRASKYNEQPKTFYHPEFGEYFGKTSDLKRKYPDYIDEGTLYQLSTFRIKQHKGWVTDPLLLEKLEKTDRGTWRLRK